MKGPHLSSCVRVGKRILCAADCPWWLARRREKQLRRVVMLATELRQAALDWTRDSKTEPKYYNDREFMKIDRRLLRAAQRYSKAVEETRR